MMLLVVIVPLAVAGLLVLGWRALRSGHRVDLRRLAPALAGTAGVMVVFGILTGGGATPFVPLVGALALVVLGAGALLRSSRAPALPDGSWSGPTLAPAGVGNVGPTAPPSAASVARALGWVEARELASSPWFGVGIGFCVLMLALFGFVYAGENGQSWAAFVQWAPWFAHPLVGMVVLAAYRGVTRAARDGASELLDTCPTAPDTRTVGFLWTALVPVAAISVFFAVFGAVVAVTSPGLHGPLGMDSAAVALSAVVLGAGGVALGVALGRWVRFALAPVVAVVAVGFASIALNGVGGRNWNPLVSLATAPSAEGPSPIFEDRHPGSHLVWLLALTVVVGATALARHRRDRPLALGAAVAAAVLLASGIAATRPLSAGSATHIAGLVANPEAHQECRAAGGPVTVCAYPFHREILDRTVDDVRPMASALPVGIPPLTIRQVYGPDPDGLPPEVRRLLADADMARPAGEVPLGFGEDIVDVFDSPSFDLALVAAGLPVEPDGDLVPAVVAGQARGVVVLWLATRGRDAAVSASDLAGADPSSTDAFERGSLSTGMCSVPSVVWSGQDLAAARALVARPEAEVGHVLGADWERWLDPRTGTDDLLAALDLPAVGPFDDVVARPGQPC